MTAVSGLNTHHRNRHSRRPGRRAVAVPTARRVSGGGISRARVFLAVLFTTISCAGAAGRGTIDLASAVVVAPSDLSAREKKAVEMLIDEVAKRTRIRWKLVSEWPRGEKTPAIVVGQGAQLERQFPETAPLLKRQAPAAGAEGYRIQTAKRGLVLVAGNDPRGVLFGAGRLLRELRMARDTVTLPADFQEASAPRTRLRGHQLGYRPKTNSYDAWDLPQWEQYYRDMAIFGANVVELIPPRSDDDADSPHFPRPPLDMMVSMSQLADDYGLDVWLWYPALDEDYSRPETVEFALKEWEEVFKKLPRINALFVPGGDPGATPPKLLMPLLEKQAASLRKFHPEATLWVAPQGFDAHWLDDFLEILRGEPKWFNGLVFGPQIRVSLPELRKLIPARYPIRGYPDITHSTNCQHPVPDWDAAFAVTQGREVINPRPLGQAAIYRYYHPATIGFITYSEGCNDDVNKFVWSGLGWNEETPVEEILRQYARVFIGPHHAEAFAQGLLALERNWVGPLLTNGNVETTLLQFQTMEQSATPADLRNWRFQQGLYRAYYDAFVRERLIAETAQRAEAMTALRQAQRTGSLAAMDEAHAILARGRLTPAAQNRRTRLCELAEGLFQSIRMQLDTARYKGQPGRGTSQNTIDTPLNDRVWLEGQFDLIRKEPVEARRLALIRTLILDRTDPGPGGFYDDLGDPARQPHLVRGAGFENDPDFRRSSFLSFDLRPDLPREWTTYALSMYDGPLTMHYDRLDPKAEYRIRAVYAADSFRAKIRLEADGKEIHPLMDKTDPPATVIDHEIPAAATADGELTLQWFREPGKGGNGRGCQVREVWLIRKGG
jgi:hypothetical protein